MRFCLAVALVLLGLQGRALASPERVVFERPACVPVAFDEGALERLLRIELAAAGVHEVVIAAVSVEPDAKRAPPAARLALDGACADGDGIVAKLGTSASTMEVARWIPLGDVPRAARSRTVAMALAELVRSSWPALAAELSPIAPPPPAEVPPAPPMSPPGARGIPSEEKSTPARPVVPARALRWTVAATGEARGFFPQGSAFFGGHVGARMVRAPFAVSASVGAWRSSRSDPLGDVDAWLVSGAIGAAAGGRAGAVELYAGPEIEIGWAHARGTPMKGARGFAGDDCVVLAGLRGELRFPIAGRVSGVLDAGIGAALRGFVARADARAPLALRNASARAGVGVAVAF